MMNPIVDKSIGLVVCMNKREFDHHLPTFTNGKLLEDTIIHLVTYLDSVKDVVDMSSAKSSAMSSSKSGAKKKGSSKSYMDYINSSSMSVMLKHLMALNHEISIDSLSIILKTIKIIKNCLIYTLLDYTECLSSLVNGGIVMEQIMMMIHQHDLWIPEDKIDDLIIKINRFSPYITHSNTIANILAKFPHLPHHQITICKDNAIEGDVLKHLINQQMISLNKKMTKVQRKKWLNDYHSVLQEDVNHIVDGHNVFFNLKCEKTNLIDIPKLITFIHQRKDDTLLFVFNSKHSDILKTITESYDTEINPDAKTQHGVKNIRFIFTPRGKDDDLVSLSLWMNSVDNILYSKDMFDNHVKHFHDNQYWHSLWKWFLSTHCCVV